jgi:hypothetical protein
MANQVSGDGEECGQTLPNAAKSPRERLDDMLAGFAPRSIQPIVLAAQAPSAAEEDGVQIRLYYWIVANVVELI